MATEKLTAAQLRRRIDAAQGKIPGDLVFRQVTYLDVFACEWRTGDVTLLDGVVVSLEPGGKAAREIDGRGKFLVPGFIDAHVHVESSLLVPANFQRAVLPKGTTTAICDPHELANVMGPSGIRYFLDEAEKMQLDLRVMLSSCVPATDFETNGAGHIVADELLKLRSHPKALGLAEMMNVPGVLHGVPEVIDKLEAFSGDRIDGHCPLVRGRALSACAVAGIASCHESTQLEEAREKLTKGMGVWIREGSVAKDLHALAPLLTLASSTSVAFCTDDRNPLDIATEGHIDFLVRESIRLGVPSEVAFRAAAWTPARHYGLGRRGAIAPGYLADLILLDDKQTVAINKVLKAGRFVDELDMPAAARAGFANSIRAVAPQPVDLLGPEGKVHVIGVEAGKILTGRSVRRHDAPGVARLSVLERYGHGSRPANAYVSGFGEKFRGAIGSSVGHDSHNLIVVGSNERDMSIAFGALAASGGGYCIVSDGAVKAQLPLPYGGLMTTEDASSLRGSLQTLRDSSRAIGCELPEPFLQLAFLSLPVIPSLKLTDKGLVDVNQFKLVDVRA